MKWWRPGFCATQRFFLTGMRLIWYKYMKVKFVDLILSGRGSAWLSGSQDWEVISIRGGIALTDKKRTRCDEKVF